LQAQEGAVDLLDAHAEQFEADEVQEVHLFEHDKHPEAPSS
jgi:hypothetical protein